MKNLPLLIFSALGYLSSLAQPGSGKYTPDIKAGTRFEYTFSGKATGDFLVSGQILSTEKGFSFVDTLKFSGKLQVVKFVISKKAMETGTKMRPPNEEPTSNGNGVTLFVLSDDKTDHCFSRGFIKTLLAQKSASYGGIQYNLMDIPAGQEVKIGDKEVDALYIVSANGKKKFWILNDPLFPFILKSSSDNINVLLTGISN